MSPEVKSQLKKIWGVLDRFYAYTRSALGISSSGSSSLVLNQQGDWIANTASSGTNIVVVDKTVGVGDFTSIKDAVDSIVGSSPANQFVVNINPGIYVEDTITMKSGISLYARTLGDVIIMPTVNTNTIINTIDSSSLINIVLTGATGVGGKGIYHTATTGAGALIRDCNFNGNYINLHCYGNSAVVPSVVYVDRTSHTGATTYGYLFDNGGTTNTSRGVITNCTYQRLLAGVTDEFITMDGINTFLTITNSTFRAGGFANKTFCKLTNGAELRMTASTVRGFDIGLHIENSGANTSAKIVGSSFTENLTWDILNELVTATGNFQGIASHAKVQSASPDFVWNFLDADDGELEITNDLAITYSDGTHTNISSLLTEGATMGVIDGGELSDGGGFQVDVAAGYGYYSVALPTTVVTRVDWNSTSITLAANQDRYIYFNNSGVLTSNGSQPDTRYNILLGRVVTNGVGIELIDQVPSIAEHTSNRFGALFREAMGAIYAFGSIVTENATPFHLDVTGGEYYYASNEFVPSGAVDLTFTPTLNGAIQTPISLVPKSWDNAGVLTALTGAEWAKHSLYVVGDGVNEKYYLVYGQQTFGSLAAAETGDIPLPPTFIKDGVILIAGIIVQGGTVTISEIVDQRPVIGFRASGVSGTSDHLSLTNLTNGDAGHTQFMMLDGSTPMAADLDMGSNGLTNLTTVNGTALTEWLIRNGNTYGANTVFGLTDAFSLGIRTNNIDRILISSGGTITLSNLVDASTGVIGATSTGLLTRSVSTTDLTEGTNLYYLDSRARASISSTATGLTYTSGSGVLSLTAGYVIPTTTQETNWNTAYTNRITSLTTTGNFGAATLAGNTLNIPQYSSVISFSSAANLGVGTNTTLFFLRDGVSAPNATDSTAIGTRIVSPVTGTISKLYVTFTTAPGANGRTVTVYINGVATALTTGVITTATGNNTATSVNINAGDTISVAVINGAGAPVQSDGATISFLLG